MKKKVLQLIDGLNVGGAEMLFIDLIRGLTMNNYEVVVGYSTPGPLEKKLRDMNLRLVNLPHFFRVDPILFFRICLLILREKPDIVHTHLFKSDFHGRIAAWLCRTPLIISTIHNNNAWVRKFPLGRIYGWTAGLAHCIIAVSDKVREYHIQYTHTDARKIEVISNGVDISRFAGTDVDPCAIRKELCIDQTAPLIGVIGRLEPQKDHENFLKAASLIAKKMPAARFLVVGDGSLRDALIGQTSQMQLTDRVIFTEIRQDIPAILSALDVLVISSRWEGLPVTLLEALAARCVVVATQVGGISDVVRSEESALLVPAEDPASLAEACLRVLHDRDLAQRLAKAGFERVSSQFGIDAMIQKTIESYQTLWSKYVPSSP